MKRLTHRAICGAAGVLAALSVGPAFGQEAFSGHSGTNPAVARNKAADPPKLVSTGRIGLLAAASADQAGHVSAGASPQGSTGFLGRRLGLREDAVAQRAPVGADRIAASRKAPAEYVPRHAYREISDFFNVREANANVTRGVWELELEGAWVTESDGEDDDVTFTPNIKYGITDDMFVELEVLPLNLGDGADQGNGDLSLQLFYQWLHEQELCPALATWVEMRIPTGQGSSGVDGELHVNLTKTLIPKFRVNLEGFVETANGGRGRRDENRRPFQWGVGPGLDYQLDEKTIAAINYLNRSSEELGNPNQNILEIGLARELVPGQHLKFAVDVGLDGHEETPTLAAKLQWSIEW